MCQVIPDRDVASAEVVVGSLDPSFTSVFSEGFDDSYVLVVHGPGMSHLFQEWVTQYSVFIFGDGLGDTYVGFHCDFLTEVISDLGSIFSALRTLTGGFLTRNLQFNCFSPSHTPQ